MLDMNKLQQLAARRTQLLVQITKSRDELGESLSDARKDVLFAGLGFLVHKILTKHPFIRIAAMVALAIGTKTSIFSKLGLKDLFPGTTPR